MQTKNILNLFDIYIKNETITIHMKRSELVELIRQEIKTLKNDKSLTVRKSLFEDDKLDDAVEILDSEDDVEQLMKDFTKQLAAKKGTLVVKESKKNLKEGVQIIDESLVLTVAGVALAIPKIMELISWLVSKFAKLFKIETTKPEEIKKLAEKIHHKYIAMIEFAVRGLGVKDPKKSKALANGLLTLIIAGLFVTSGAGAIHAAKSAHVGLAGFEGFLAAIKGSEVAGKTMEVGPKAIEILSGLITKA